MKPGVFHHWWVQVVRMLCGGVMRPVEQERTCLQNVQQVMVPKQAWLQQKRVSRVSMELYREKREDTMWRSSHGADLKSVCLCLEWCCKTWRNSLPGVWRRNGVQWPAGKFGRHKKECKGCEEGLCEQTVMEPFLRQVSQGLFTYPAHLLNCLSKEYFVFRNQILCLFT